MEEQKEHRKATFDEENQECTEPNSLQWQAGTYFWLLLEKKAIYSSCFFMLATAFGALGKTKLTIPGEAFKEKMMERHDEYIRAAKELGEYLMADYLRNSIIWAVKAAREAKAAHPDYERDRIDMCVDPEFK